MIARFRHLSFAAALALALLFGQFVATQHALGHATRAIQGQEHPGTPLEKTCDTHFSCAQLGSAVGSAPPVFALPEAAPLPRVIVALPGEQQAALLAYRSQAPPVA